MNASNLLPVRTASCSVFGDYAIKKKMTVPYSKAKKGDIVLYDFNHNGTSDHTGIVYKVVGSKIYVVEGNTSLGNDCNGGAVLKRTRVKGDVNYLVRPKYTSKVTADMIVATALSQVGVKESPKNSNNVKYNTWFYGKEVRGSAYPWCMVFVCWCFAHVKTPAKPLPKPKPTYTGKLPAVRLKKGSKGEHVRLWQKFLNWYHPAWHLGVDGKFGNHTTQATKSFQKNEHLTVDGVVGAKTLARAKTYLKKTAPAKPTAKVVAPKATKQQKLIAKMDELAWAYGTPAKKYSYKTGAPKAVCKKAMKKYGWADNKAEMSDCGNFVSTVVREAGIDKSFKALHGVKTPFPKSEKAFKIIHSGKDVPGGLLKPGDIVRYKKTNGKQHALFYYGNGKVCEASHHNIFGAIRKDTKRYDSQAKKSTIQVLRAKE